MLDTTLSEAVDLRARYRRRIVNLGEIITFAPQMIGVAILSLAGNVIVVVFAGARTAPPTDGLPFDVQAAVMFARTTLAALAGASLIALVSALAFMVFCIAKYIELDRLFDRVLERAAPHLLQYVITDKQRDAYGVLATHTKALLAGAVGAIAVSVLIKGASAAGIVSAGSWLVAIETLLTAVVIAFVVVLAPEVQKLIVVGAELVRRTENVDALFDAVTGNECACFQRTGQITEAYCARHNAGGLHE
jgi:hypothetical protein